MYYRGGCTIPVYYRGLVYYTWCTPPTYRGYTLLPTTLGVPPLRLYCCTYTVGDMQEVLLDRVTEGPPEGPGILLPESYSRYS